MVADLRQRKGKISGCFKNSTSIVLQQCQNKGHWHRSMLDLKDATMTTEAQAIAKVRGYNFCPDVILDRFRGAQFLSQK